MQAWLPFDNFFLGILLCLKLSDGLSYNIFLNSLHICIKIFISLNNLKSFFKMQFQLTSSLKIPKNSKLLSLRFWSTLFMNSFTFLNFISTTSSPLVARHNQTSNKLVIILLFFIVSFFDFSVSSSDFFLTKLLSLLFCLVLYLF